MTCLRSVMVAVNGVAAHHSVPFAAARPGLLHAFFYRETAGHRVAGRCDSHSRAGSSVYDRRLWVRKSYTGQAPSLKVHRSLRKVSHEKGYGGSGIGGAVHIGA